MRKHTGLRAAALLSLLLLAGLACDRPILPEFFAPATPHEAYGHALRQAGLLETALGREWLGAGNAALRTPTRVALPIQETGYLAPDRPRAVAFQVNLVRGRRLVLQTDLAPAPGALLFLDVFAVPESPADSLRHVVSADSGIRYLEFEPRRTGDYVIRLQPELLRGGRYTLTLRTEPALAFPVQGMANASIGSGFGAPRDGGVRDHHGIDIFAPRGTPVLAAANGVVTRVQETPRGGRVVWVRDEQRGNSLYYAHLDRQLVEGGATVSIGDTIGLVGSTGNARTTPPHLHFGIYRRGEGPTDPRPWVARVNARIPPLRADTQLLNGWARVHRPTRLRAAPDTGAATLRPLPAETIVRIVGAQSTWYHAALPDGSIGFVLAADAGSAATPLRSRALASPLPIRAEPRPHAAVIDTLAPATVHVYGRLGDWLYVRADSQFGWLPD